MPKSPQSFSGRVHGGSRWRFFPQAAKEGVRGMLIRVILRGVLTHFLLLAPLTSTSCWWESLVLCARTWQPNRRFLECLDAGSKEICSLLRLGVSWVLTWGTAAICGRAVCSPFAPSKRVKGGQACCCAGFPLKGPHPSGHQVCLPYNSANGIPLTITLPIVRPAHRPAR